MIGIKVPGQFVPGTVDGFVTEARWVKGTYIVVKTVEEANLVPMSVRVDGTLVYVSDNDTEYRWIGDDWEVIPKSFSDAPVDGKIYARQNGLWTIVDLDAIDASIDQIKQELSLKANSSDLSGLQAQIEQVESQLSNYVPYTELKNYIQMKLGPLPDKGEANTLYFVQSDNGYEFYIWWNDAAGFALIGSTDVDLSQYYTKSEVDALLQGVEQKIPDVSNLATKQELAQKADVSSIPTKVSQLENDTGFITNDALVGYALKTDIPDVSVFALKTEIPTNLSQLTNDAGYITKDVNDLTNYETAASINAKLDQKADKSEIPDVSGFATSEQLTSGLAGKQDTLVSGTNIKTINGQSILGAGNIEIQGGSGGSIGPATEDTLGGILATNLDTQEGTSAYVDVEEDGKAFVKIPNVSETSSAQDVVNTLSSDGTLVLNGNA